MPKNILKCPIFTSLMLTQKARLCEVSFVSFYNCFFNGIQWMGEERWEEAAETYPVPNTFFREWIKGDFLDSV